MSVEPDGIAAFVAVERAFEARVAVLFNELCRSLADCRTKKTKLAAAKRFDDGLDVARRARLAVRSTLEG